MWNEYYLSKVNFFFSKYKKYVNERLENWMAQQILKSVQEEKQSNKKWTLSLKGWNGGVFCVLYLRSRFYDPRLGKLIEDLLFEALCCGLHDSKVHFQVEARIHCYQKGFPIHCLPHIHLNSSCFEVPKIDLENRKPIYSTFAEQYGIITKDMVKPYKAYPTFNEFFTRQVKPRIINPAPQIVLSPADSKVLSISQVNSDDCLLVKGINYKLGHFLTGVKDYVMDSDELNAHYRVHNGSTIWSCILYLAPGDYHRYHCPTDYLAKGRKHVIGSLAPVKESYISKYPGVYEGNERVVLDGEWREGFMFITFVGAMNVGSMTVNFDHSLATNQSNDEMDLVSQRDYTEIKNVSAPYVKKEGGVHIPKGAEIGRFNMGSTVVLVFESKNQIKWNVRAGEKVRYGQPLFAVEEN